MLGEHAGHGTGPSPTYPSFMVDISQYIKNNLTKMCWSPIMHETHVSLY